MNTAETINIVVASLNRPRNVGFLLDQLATQTLLPKQVVLSLETEGDCPTLNEYPYDVKIVYGTRGTSAQRNRGLDAVEPADIIMFYDDDFVPSRFALEDIVRAFNDHPEAGGLTGKLLADGAQGAGISPNDALEIVKKADQDRESLDSRTVNMSDKIVGLYGCNMAYRYSAIGDERFDEDLPLYGWQEDVDFSARISGRTSKTDAFYGVHCGEKTGREKSGVILGYSQIANNFYLYRKGTMSGKAALRLAARNFSANHMKMFFSEPWIDRKGRAAGNWIAIFDVMRRRDHPKRIFDL